MKKQMLAVILVVVLALSIGVGLTLDRLNEIKDERITRELQQMKVIGGVTFKQAIDNFTENNSIWICHSGRVHISSFGAEHRFSASVVPDAKTGEIHFKSFIIDGYTPANSQEMDAILYDLAVNVK